MPSKYKALNDASRLAHADLTGASPNPEHAPVRRKTRKADATMYEIDTTEKVLAGMDNMKAEIAEWRARCEQAEARVAELKAGLYSCLENDDCANPCPRGVDPPPTTCGHCAWCTARRLLRDTEGGSNP